MSEPDPAVLRHQVLADPTGRRRRRLTVAGRVATTILGLWLLVLILGGLGLQPLAGIPIVGHLGVRAAAPPALPGRVQAAVARHTTVAPAPLGAARIPPPSPALTAPARARTRAPARTTPPRIKPAPVRALTSPAPAPAPALTTTSSSSIAPGQIHTETSPSSTAPGQTKTEPGPPTTTPGTTPGSNGEAHGKAKVTAP